MTDEIREPELHLSNEKGSRPRGRARVVEGDFRRLPPNDGKDPTGGQRQSRWRQRHPEQHRQNQRRRFMKTMHPELYRAWGWGDPTIDQRRQEIAYEAMREAARCEVAGIQWFSGHGAELIKRLAEKPAP
jgi:hypothetical protein